MLYEKKMNKTDVILNRSKIKCPHCGYEYLPAEIFSAKYLLGRPTDIVRTPAGDIDFYLGEEPDLVESYICDHCQTEFSVSCHLTFDIVEGSNYNFDDDYTTKIPQTKKEVNLFE